MPEISQAAEPRHNRIMTQVRWCSFKTSMPDDNCAILVRDHEGNFSPGIWRGEFVPFLPIPIGPMKKWSYIKVAVRRMPEYDIIDPENIYLNNGSMLRMTEIYDFDDPIKISKPY